MKKKQIQLFLSLLALFFFANNSLSFSISHSSFEKIIKSKPQNQNIISASKDQMAEKLPENYRRQIGSEVSNFTIPFDNLQGNMLILEKFILIPQNSYPYPIINRINLETKAVEKLSYPNITEWQQSGNSLVLSILPSGDIAFGANRLIMILDRDTLQVKQSLPGSQADEKVRKFYSFTDPKTSESKILVKKHSQRMNGERLYELNKDLNTGKYSQSLLSFYQEIINQFVFDFEMTGLNTAISVYRATVSDWKNFKIVIDYSRDLKNSLIDRQKVALSYSEQYFVMYSYNNKYEFYGLKENYEVHLQKSIFVAYNQHVRGEFTSDDRNLFVLMRTPKKQLNIAKINVEKGQFSLVKDSSGNPDNHLDFNLFAAETDRMVVLVQKGTEYALQLRATTNLSIIHEIPLSFNFTVLKIKLVGNVDWGLTFAVIAQYQDNYYTIVNSWLSHFNIQGSKIINTGLKQYVHYDYVHACYKYLIAEKPTINTIIFLYSQNLTIALEKKLEVHQKILCEKQIMIIGEEEVEFYDLSKSLDLQGIFFKENELLAQREHFLFPKRRLALDITTKLFRKDQVSRILLDLSKLQVKSTLVFKTQKKNTDQMVIYHPLDGSCDKIYYTEYSVGGSSRRVGLNQPLLIPNPNIGSYDQCKNASQTYNLGIDDYCRVKMIFSSNKEYLLIFLQAFFTSLNGDFLLQIRKAEDIGKVMFTKVFQFGQLYQPNHSINYIGGDLIDDSTLIIKSQKFLHTATIKLESNNIQDGQKNI